MKISTTTLPDNSLLNNNPQKYDYIDSFQSEINDPNNKIVSSDVGKAFFSSAPKWVEALMTLRNKIVSVFGLKISNKISNRQQQLDDFKCEKGEQLGLFKVFEKNNNEVILGENDKHLDFRVSLFIENIGTHQEKKMITISTTVMFHNWFGKAYFQLIRPFHRLIVPKMLKGILEKIAEKQTNK